ncbi:MAG TPA: hypothetical protein VGN01_12895 [Acidobacteriaceae bacterium]
MSRCTLRNIFTVFIYAGVALFLYPYVTGHFSNALFYLVVGIGLAVLCGILRCACIEGDCPDRVPGPPTRNAGPPSPQHPAGR